jgi:tellurite resistance protein
MVTSNQTVIQPREAKTVSSIVKYFPISFYSVVLGLAGFAIALQKVEQISGLTVAFSQYILYFVLLVFAVITLLYLLKIVIAPEEFKTEFRHPNKINFFPAFSISLLLFSVALLEINILAARILWIFGVILNLYFTLKILSYWIQHTKLEITHMNPVWFLPVVGNIIVPVAGVALFSKEISWFFFSIGLVFWLILFSILFNRILFHSPMPEKLLPTFFILIAPPAVGFISYVKLSGVVNDFARVLFYFALFVFVLLAVQLKYIYRPKFFLSWWAYAFPIAAITIAAVLMFRQTEIEFFKWLAYFLFFVLFWVILGLSVKTIRALGKKEIFVKED